MESPDINIRSLTPLGSPWNGFWWDFPGDDGDWFGGGGGGGGGGISYGSRTPGTTAPAGPLARSDREHIVSRGQSPTDSRKLIYAADAPNRGGDVSDDYLAVMANEAMDRQIVDYAMGDGYYDFARERERKTIKLIGDMSGGTDLQEGLDELAINGDHPVRGTGKLILFGATIAPGEGPLDALAAKLLGPVTKAAGPVVKVAGEAVEKIAIWTATKTKTAIQNAFRHFKDHGAEFGVKNALEYVQRAREFVTHPPPGTLQKVRPSNGDVVLYDPVTNTFAVKDATGAPRTMFKPDPKEHGYPTNLDYFNAQ